MIFRTGFFEAASFAVFIVARSKINCRMSRETPNRKFSEKNDGGFKQEEEEKEVQNLGSKAIDELERKVSEENEWINAFQLHNKDWNCVIEIEMLKNVAKKMEKRRKSLEMKLLELYCLKKQQQSSIAQLRKDLKLKIVEIDMLNATINSLQTEKIRLGEEIKQNGLAEKQLENATKRSVDMQNKKCAESAQMKGQLTMVKEQLSGFKLKEMDGFKDDKFEEKISAMKNVELVGVELKRNNKELQLEMREFTVKLVTAQTRITALTNVTESKTIAKAEDEIRCLSHSNEVILEQVVLGFGLIQLGAYGGSDPISCYPNWLN